MVLWKVVIFQDLIDIPSPTGAIGLRQCVTSEISIFLSKGVSLH